MHKIKWVRPILLLIIVCVRLTSFAQQSHLDQKISLTVSDKSVYEILEQIETVGKVSFSFKSGLFDKHKQVSITVENATVREVLEQLLKDKSLFFYELGDKVIVYRPSVAELKEKPKVKENPKVRIFHSPPPQKINQKIITVFDTSRVLISETLIDSVTIVDTVVRTVIDTVVVNDTAVTVVEKHLSEKSWIVGARAKTSIVKQRFDAYNKLQEKAFSPLLSWGGGALLAYKTGNVEIETGTSVFNNRYSYSIDEKVKYIDSTFFVEENVWQWERRFIDDYFEYKDGDTIKHEVWDTVYVLTKQVSYNTSEDTLVYNEKVSNLLIEIPLVLRYIAPISEIHNIGVSSAVIGTIHINNKTLYVVEENGRHMIADINHNNVIFSLNSSFSLFYRYVKPKQFYFQIEPFASVSISPVMLSDSNIPFYRAEYGVFFTAGFWLGKK